jgi:hypothetical protein
MKKFITYYELNHTFIDVSKIDTVSFLLCIFSFVFSQIFAYRMGCGRARTNGITQSSIFCFVWATQNKNLQNKK